MASKKRSGSQEVLIADYQEASESARGCNQRIFQSFYLSLVFLAFMIGTIVTGYDRYPSLLPIASIVSAIAFIILYLTIHILRGTRNSAWARRRQIENKIKGLRTDESIRKRLEVIEEGKEESFISREKDWWERRSVATWMEYFALGAFGGWLFVFVVSLGIILC